MKKIISSLIISISLFLSISNTFAFDGGAGYVMVTKEYGLDTIANAFGALAIEAVKTEMLNWVAKGFEGKPLFVDNPEQMFKNIATDQLVTFKKQLLGASGTDPQNRAITKLLIAATEGEESFKNAIIPTIGLTICTKIKTEMSTAKNGGDTTQLSILKASYDNMCAGKDKKTEYKNQQACAADFSCSGFDSILAITQNFAANTEAGRYEATLAKYQADLAKKTEDINSELDRGDGYLNNKKCIATVKENADGTGKKICTKYEQLTPGSSAASIVDQVIKDPLAQLENVDEITEMVTKLAISYAFKTGISKLKSESTSEYKTGLDKLQKDLKDGIKKAQDGGKEVEKKQNQKVNDSVNKINKKGSSASSTGSSGTSGTGGASSCYGSYVGTYGPPDHDERIRLRNMSLTNRGIPITSDEDENNANAGGGPPDGGIWMGGSYSFETDSNCNVVTGETLIFYAYEYDIGGTVNKDGMFNLIWSGQGSVGEMKGGVDVNNNITGQFFHPAPDDFVYGVLSGTFTPAK